MISRGIENNWDKQQLTIELCLGVILKPFVALPFG
jgi:hypothetical protein